MKSKGRSLFRVVRWVGLAAAVPALWACTSRAVEAPKVRPDMTVLETFKQTLNRNVDLLFLVDDSQSMRLSQDNLIRNFPLFMRELENFRGGLPNVHIAVVSSDMGTAGFGGGGCSTSGKGGIFQSAVGPGATSCTSTGLNPGARFISNVNGQANYTGDLAQVFTCIAALGENGCGFEQQFAAITRALGADGQGPPAENHDFLRDDAYLGIIMITNEDDCSPADPRLFDTSANWDLASTLGPPVNFRCNEFGHVCEGARPSRHAPGGSVSATVDYQSCVPAEGSGLLKTVAETAAQIKALKADPAGQIIVAAITGPTAPYQVHWKPAQTADTGPWPEITHSCTAPDQSFADPSIRVTDFVRQFGGNGLLLSICDGEFADALMRIAQELDRVIQPPCIEGQIALRPGTPSPDCTVTSHTRNGGAGTVDDVVPACADTGGVGPCWELVPGQMGCVGQTMSVKPAAAGPPPTGQDATVNCSLCVPGLTDADRGCP
jgi:hypothetical protein